MRIKIEPRHTHQGGAGPINKYLDILFSIVMLFFGVAAALAGTYCLTHSIDQARAKQPVPAQVAAVHLEPPAPEADPPIVPQFTDTPLVEPVHTYNPDIPLSAELQTVLYEVCEESNVPVALALGLIEVESSFQVDAVSEKGCYGLMQLNPRFFPADLSPADNLRRGISWLAGLMEQYGDTAAALTAYNAGYDTGDRVFAEAVMAKAEYWE